MSRQAEDRALTFAGCLLIGLWPIATIWIAAWLSSGCTARDVNSINGTRMANCGPARGAHNTSWNDKR